MRRNAQPFGAIVNPLPTRPGRLYVRGMTTQTTRPESDDHSAAMPAHPSPGGDILRQVGVISATSFMIVAGVIGSGAIVGEPIQDAQGGALSAEGSLLAPAGTAFSIWSVIYVGMVLYAIWQALPSQRARDRQRRLGLLVALSAVLNGTWIVLAQFANLPATVAGIVALLLVLAVTFRGAVVTGPQSWVERVLLDGTVGLHLGWVSLATVANTAAWLTAEAPESWSDAGTPLGIAVLCVVSLLGIALAVFSGGRLAPGLAIAWGTTWISVGRLTGEPENSVLGVTAAVVAMAVLIVTAVVAVATSSRRRVPGK